MLIKLDMELPQDRLLAFADALASVRLRHDIRRASTIARKPIRRQLETVRSGATKLRKLLLGEAGSNGERERDPNGIGRLEGYLRVDGGDLDVLCEMLGLVAAGATAELAQIETMFREIGELPTSEQESLKAPGDHLVKELVSIAEDLGITVTFPVDDQDQPCGAFVDLARAVDSQMTGAAVKAAYYRSRPASDCS